MKERLDRRLIASIRTKKIPHVQQLKFFSRLLSVGERTWLIISVVVFVAAGVALSVRWYWQNTVAIPDQGGTYTEGLVGMPRYINPLLAPANDVDRDLSSLIFSGLMRYDAQGNIVPDLADGWDISSDNKVYTVKLRDNTRWHDGEALTADDVVYTFKQAQDANYKSPLRVSISGVTIAQTDERTVTFTLKDPFPGFLSVLTTGIIPKHVWYSVPSANAHLAEANIRPIGSGMFRFKNLNKDSSGVILNMTLERNPRYYGQTPYLDNLTFKFYPDFGTGVEALKNKNIDGLSFLPLEYYDDVAGNKNFNLKSLSLPQYTAIFFNPEQNEVLKNKNIRQALARATDRQRIVAEALNGNGQVINAPIPPGSVGYLADAQSFDYQPEEASKLLEKEGWVKKDGAPYRSKGDKELTVKLTTVDQGENTAAINIIKENWEAIGVKTELTIIPKGNVKQEVIEPRNYELLLFGQIIGRGQDPYAFWHSGQNRHPGNGLSLLVNRDIDTILEQLRQTSDVKQQEGLYEKFQVKLLQEVFAIWLYRPIYIYPVNKKIKGLDEVQSISVPADRFTTINRWYIKTKRGKK